MFTPKHQRLVIQCYPKGKKNFEKQPKSSELSYLLYYCNSRRTKLTKVSAFLKKKATKDINSKRIGDVYVTMVIISNIITSCKENLGIFFDDFMFIIFNVLKQPVFRKDDYILDGVVHFFKSLALNLDSGFISNLQINDFHKFLEIYFHEVVPKDVTKMDALQQKRLLSGCVLLPKIKCIKHMDFFRDLLFESIYKTLKIYQINNNNINVVDLGEEVNQIKETSNEKLEQYEPHMQATVEDTDERLSRRLTHIRSASDFKTRPSFENPALKESTGIMPIGLDDMDPSSFADDEVNKLSLETLKEFFNASESDILQISVRALNTVMVELPNVYYYRFIVSGIPVQLRYVCILLTVNGIVNSQNKTVNDESLYSSNTNSSVLLKLIADLILSEVSIVALSVVDIVKKLINFQISFTSSSNTYNAASDELMKQIPYIISILTTRTFYKDQLSDLLHEILNLIEIYLDKNNAHKILELLYNDMSMIINYLDRTQNEISLSLFNDVTMILRDNLTKNNYLKLFDITSEAKDLNNQTCLTFFESVRQLNSLFDKYLTGKILALAFKKFKSSILLAGLSFYKMIQKDHEAVSEDYFIYHQKAAQFLMIKDYENKVQLITKENRYFTSTELLNYYSDEKSNPYSTNGYKILTDYAAQSNTLTSSPAELQATEDEIFHMMNTSLQSLNIQKSPSFSRHVDVKSLSGLQNHRNESDEPSVDQLKSLLKSNNNNSAVSKLKRNNTSASQSVKSKVTNITFLLTELQDSSKNLKIRMPNEDQVSQLDERIIKRNKLNRNSFSNGRKSFENSGVLSPTFSNSNRISTTNSNSSMDKAISTQHKSNNKSDLIDIKKSQDVYNEEEQDDDEFNFVDASSDVSSIGELDNRGNLFT